MRPVGHQDRQVGQRGDRAEGLAHVAQLDDQVVGSTSAAGSAEAAGSGDGRVGSVAGRGGRRASRRRGVGRRRGLEGHRYSSAGARARAPSDWTSGRGSDRGAGSAAGQDPPPDPAALARFVRVFVLGIDPGLSRCGYGVLEPAPAGRPGPVALGRAHHAARPTRCPSAWPSCSASCGPCSTSSRPTALAVERVLFQVNVRTAMSVGPGQRAGHGRGRRRAAARSCSTRPNQVKQAVAGYGAATKEQVQRMVQTLLGLAELPRPARRGRRRRPRPVPPGHARRCAAARRGRRRRGAGR